jgi:hypothetical protein
VAENDPHAVELLRVWAAQRKQHVSLASHLWNDPASWGIMLVDLAKHIANSYEQSRGDNHAEVLQRIRAGFDAEWGKATDAPTGRLSE